MSALSLGNPATGQVAVSAITSTARAWHDDKGFHATTDVNIGKIVFTVGGVPTEIPIPAPGQPFTIPGLVTISVGVNYTKVLKHSATARAKGIRITLPAAGTVAKVAASNAIITDGIVSGRFTGNAHTTRVAVAGTLVTSGDTVKSLMPCQGTGGKVKEKSLAGTNLADQIVVGAAANRQMGKQVKGLATAFEEAKLASIDLGNGALVITGIRARANVSRSAKGLVRNADGTTIGSITAGGTEYAIPDPGQSLEIPGVAAIKPNVVTTIKNGLHVIALQITLLDGSGAVINVGEVELRVLKR